MLCGVCRGESSRGVNLAEELTAFRTAELGQRTDLLEELVERLTRDEGGEGKEVARLFRDRLGERDEDLVLLTLKVLEQTIRATSGAPGARYHDHLETKGVTAAVTALTLSDSSRTVQRRAEEVLEQWALSVLWDAGEAQAAAAPLARSRSSSGMGLSRAGSSRSAQRLS